jgi:hypothetical protein
MGRRNDVDWDAIKKNYRVGLFTLRQLGKLHGAHYTAIGRRAEKEQWAKDLTEEVRDRTRVALLSGSTESYNKETAVAAAVETNLAVLRDQKTSIGRGQKIVTQLFADLRSAGEEIALPQKAAALGALATALKTLIALERQAFNLDTAPPPDRSESLDPITDDARVRALAVFFARTRISPSD